MLLINNLDKNHTEARIGNVVILFSYGTPIAYQDQNRTRVYLTDRKFSKTTTAHMNMWADGLDCVSIPHDTIVQLVSEVGFCHVF